MSNTLGMGAMNLVKQGGITPIYNPIEFIQEVEVLTLTVIGSFASWRLLSVLYDNIYEPVIDEFVDGGETDKYYAKIGKYYVPIGVITKEFIKWFIIVVLLMLIYNGLQWMQN